jgi:hypothetical protein
MSWKLAMAVSAAGLALCAATGANATSDASAVKQTIRSVFTKANAGDTAGAGALFAASGSIIDEFAPFRWASFGDWGQAFGAYNAQTGVTGSKTTILKFNHVNVGGGRAYAVATVAYTYKENGKPRKEPGTEVFSLEKADAGWRIDSFAWFSKAGVDSGADASAIIDTVHGFASMSAPPSPPPTAITDEFAPFHWEGVSANADWFAAFQKDSAAGGVTDIALHLSAPSHLSVNGDKAYAVFPTVIADKHHGKTEQEHGAFAFALEKSSGSWRIASWAWATR